MEFGGVGVVQVLGDGGLVCVRDGAVSSWFREVGLWLWGWVCEWIESVLSDGFEWLCLVG